MRLIFLYLSFLLSIAVHAQDDCAYYQKYINKGNNHLKNQQFREAINSYSIALVHCPAKTNETWELIMIAFQKIEELKDIAMANETRAIENERKAIENEKAAKSAKWLSDAYKFIFFAQETVKNDPMLALHLADTSLKILDSAGIIHKTDSSIYEKALRIYYENNFGETLVDKTNMPSVKGNFIKAAYAADGKSIWTLTDSAFACQWNLNGKLMAGLPLDTTLNVFEFKKSGEGQIIIHGYDRNKRYPSGKIWMLEKPGIVLEIPSNMASSISQEKRDSVTLNPKRDTTAGWAKKLFYFGDRAFHITKDFQLLPMVSDANKAIRHVAFSPDGEAMALSNGSREISVIKKDKNENYTITSGFVPSGIQFTPDSKMIALNNSVAMELYENNKKGAGKKPEYFNLPGYALQTIDFSQDGKMLLLNFSHRFQQAISLFKKNNDNWKSGLYAEFKCPGASSTSVAFSRTDTGFISSSDKIRKWVIPSQKSEPSPNISGSQRDSIQIISVAFDPQEQVINAFSSSGLQIKFNRDGTRFQQSSDYSTYVSDSIAGSLALPLSQIKKVVRIINLGRIG